MAAAEQKKSYAVVKQFRSLNTKANRTAIDESEFAWLENAQPIGYANLKIIPTSEPVLRAGLIRFCSPRLLRSLWTLSASMRKGLLLGIALSFFSSTNWRTRLVDSPSTCPACVAV
jgi:hypothetical protein